MANGQRRFFFIHVMKTAGGTLRAHIRANFEPSEVYPSGKFELDMTTANFVIPRLTSLPAARREQVRVFAGHFPFVAVELLGIEATTLTILRHPVERTLSYLRDWRRHHDRSLSLEQIYEDPFNFPCLIRDHQAKLFALTPTDEPNSYMHVLEVDERRLELAKSNLERVDAVGLQERFGELLAELEHRYGWRFGQLPNRNVSRRRAGVPESFRRRIAADNPADMAFYEHAISLCERRRARAGTAP